MSGIYFVLEVRNAHENYKIQLTKAGWDGLTKQERTRLIKMAGGSIRDAKGWIHGKQRVAGGIPMIPALLDIAFVAVVLPINRMGGDR